MLFKRKKTASEKNLDINTNFEDIYREYWELVYAICLNNTGEMAIAQGLTQEIFLSLWERKDTLKVDFIKGYLIRSAKHKVFEYFRNQEIKSRNLRLVAQDAPMSSNSTEEELNASLLVQEVDELVGQLPEKCRNVYKMSRQQGLSNKKIASLLNITERMVEYHISKALGHLRKNLSAKNLA